MTQTPDISVFIQARMGSSRLPGKMLMPFQGLPIFEWVLLRTAFLASTTSQGNPKSYNVVVVALLPDKPESKALIEIAERLKIPFVLGDESNVASRFVKAAKQYPGDHYLRVCADNPFVCPSELDILIRHHLQNKNDYTYNHIPSENNSYVDGLGGEIFTAQLMTLLDQPMLTSDEKEHVTRYFWLRKSQFRFQTVLAREAVAFPRHSFDIDTAEDYDAFTKLKSRIQPDWTGEVILRTLKENGELDFFLCSP